MPTLPLDHGWLAAHFTELTTSACSPGPAQSRQPFEPPKPRRSTITNVYPFFRRPEPSTKSWNRSEGPAFGPTGSYDVFSAGPAGPVCPEWLKYGPIERITGVLSVFFEPFGRRMSACSVASPASDGDLKKASVQSASGYATPDAAAAPGVAATATAASTSTNRHRPNMRHPRRERHSIRPFTHERNFPAAAHCRQIALRRSHTPRLVPPAQPCFDAAPLSCPCSCTGT